MMSRFKVQSPKKHIDLSHKIHDGLITYKGLPAPLICDYISRLESREIYDNQAEFQISTINMVSNTGTYLDCPFHRFGDGDDLSQLELNELVNLEAILIRVPYTKTKEITKDFFYGYELKDKAVLVQTDWDDFWNTEEYYQNNPYLTADAATYLKDCSIKLLGIDSLNVDNLEDLSRPVHTILLGAQILIVEHLTNLRSLDKANFLFSAVPPKLEGVGTFPVRAFASL